MKLLEIVYIYESTLARIVYKFFVKKTESELSVNEQLAEELHKPVTKKNQKKKSLCKI